MSLGIMLGNRLWSKRRRLSEAEAAQVIRFWRDEFDIAQQVTTERISPHQVIGENGRPGCSLVGVVYDSRSATIYHTRSLTGEDIIHELLHVARPAWEEERVVAETARIYYRASRREPMRRFALSSG